jgi:hypothetical protein
MPSQAPPLNLGLGFSSASAAALSSPFSVYSPITFGGSTGGSVGQTATATPTATSTASPSLGGVAPSGSPLGGSRAGVAPGSSGILSAGSSGVSPVWFIGGGLALAGVILYFVYSK